MSEFRENPINKVNNIKWQLLSSVSLVGICLALECVDRSLSTPTFLQGRIVDAVGTMANSALVDAFIYASGHGGETKEAFKNTLVEKPMDYLANHRPFQSALYAFTGQCFWEVCQGAGIIPGTYDSGDFIAYGIGALGWVGLNLAGRYVNRRAFKNP